MNHNSSKYYGENGIHRVPLWRIGGFALNNTATNLYLFLMGYVAYYLGGFVGVATVTASSFAMMMRIWDGVTDPFIGFVVDKTNGRFGKNRPFMVSGNLILLTMSFVLFHVTHRLPENNTLRFGFFIVVAAVFYIGYTFQCVVTKSAQSCLTNDPKQRPLFAVFDGIYNTVLFTALAIVGASLMKKHTTPELDGILTTGFYHDMWLVTVVFSAIFTAIAVFSIAPKDRTEFFGTGKPVKVGLKDYWDTLRGNRAIQMLVVSASTDKLAASTKTSTVMIVLFGVLVGNYSLSGTLTGLVSIPGTLLLIFGVAGLATTLGQRKAMLIGSWGEIVVCGLLGVLWLIGDPTTMNGPGGALQWGYFTILYVVLSIAQVGFQGVAGNIVIPMTADCADYEVYRTGKYVPGMMGTLFSFVDKIVSSFAPMVAGLMFAMIGFKDQLPTASTPYSPSLRYVAVFLAYGMIILGCLCNVVALKFYPLTKEKMASIQEEVAAIKARAMQEAQPPA